MARFLSKRTQISHCGSGFTLIELLVVVAMVALLLALLVASLRAARTLAERVSCQSNLRQIARAWSMYLDGNDGFFYQDVNANLRYGGWQGVVNWSPRVLNPYLGLSAKLEAPDLARIFCCPGDRGGVPGAPTRQKAYAYLGTSYQTNVFLVGQDQCGAFSEKTQELDAEINARLANLNCCRVSRPSSLLLMGDYGWFNQWRPCPTLFEELKQLAEWHGRADSHAMAFLDEHVAFLEIHKGLYLTDEYNVLPFEELYDLAREVQGW
jgi:prepilin-type N-terminal cleavage/methylation domain-containing protein